MKLPLWEAVPHLCGMYLEEARRRLLLVLKVFADESGKEAAGPVFVMAGYIFRAEELIAFDDEWLAILGRSPSIDTFHMVDAIRHTDQLARLPAIVYAIKRHALHSVVVTASMSEYRDVMWGKVSDTADRPYSLMYYSLLLECIKFQMTSDLDEEMDFIFDEQGEESDHLLASWGTFIKHVPEFVKRRLGRRPIFEDDSKFPALQAADILAWSVRRKIWCLTEKKEPDSFLPTVLGAGIRTTGRHWGKEDFKALYEDAKRANVNGNRIFKHEAKLISQNADRLISGFNVNMVRQTPPEMLTRLMSIPAIGTKRYRLVHKCPDVCTPHLHTRSKNVCLERQHQRES